MSRIRTRYEALLTGEAGMTSAEYAVGTVAACGFGGIPYGRPGRSCISLVLSNEP